MPTDFLAQLPEAARLALISAGDVVEVAAGAQIIRRGEQSNDVYVVQRGRFEVVDTRSRPEVVLDAVHPGALIGEMALVERAPRTADVRADGPGAVLRWDGDRLLGLFLAQPTVEAAFWKAVAGTVAARLRNTSSNAVVGSLGTSNSPRSLSTADEERVARLAADARGGLLEADAMLGRDPDDPRPTDLVARTLRTLSGELASWLGHGGLDPERARVAGAALGAALRPYLVRSTLGALALDAEARRAGDPRLLAHVLLDQPRGEGGLGKLLDAELLAMPSTRALRQRVPLAAAGLRKRLPTQRPAALLLVGVGCGVLLARLMLHLGRQGATVRALDGAREALAWLDAGLGARPGNVALKLVQEDLAAIALGRSVAWHEPQDLIVIDGLVEHLPDQLLRNLLRWGREHLRPGGQLCLLGLGPAPDSALQDHLLEWPTARRAPRALAALCEREGLGADEVLHDGAAVVLFAVREG